MKSFHHMIRTLETFWAFGCDTVDRLTAALCTCHVLQGLLTVSRLVDEVIDPPCSQTPNKVSKLSIYVYVCIDIYIGRTRE